MMNQQGLKEKIERQHYARERHEQDLKQRMRGEGNTSGSKYQEGKGASLESS